MYLTASQEEKLQSIYNAFICDNQYKIVCLHGKSGSGKTSIICTLPDLFIEGWKCFYISGLGKDAVQYSAWMNNELFELFDSNLKLSPNISLGFGGNGFIPSLNLSIEASVEKICGYLSTTEIIMLNRIKKESEGYGNILFIADDYDEWDSASKQFLEKLLILDTRAVDKPLHAVISSCQKEEMSAKHKYLDLEISADTLSDAEINEILKNHKHSAITNLNKIRTFTGNDLNLLLLIADYNDKNATSSDIEAIYQKRYDALYSENPNACEMLKPLALDLLYFTSESAAFFSSKKEVIDEEAKILASDNLLFASQNRLITGDNRYSFSSKAMRSSFLKQAQEKKQYYHLLFAKYLDTYHPEDYFRRGIHRHNASLFHDDIQLRNTVQIMLIGLLRHISLTRTSNDYIVHTIDSVIDEIKDVSLRKEQHYIQNLAISAYVKLYSNCYIEAIDYLEKVNILYLSDVLCSELIRTKLLCYAQLADNLEKLKATADYLFNLIDSDTFNEDEQKAQSLLLLLNLYNDHIADPMKASTALKSFQQIMQNYCGNKTFTNLNAVYMRKAVLFHVPYLAKRFTENAVRYYEESSNDIEKYFACCNHMANLIVLGEYEEAKSLYLKCNRLLDDSLITYPSMYKVYNNKLLLDYLEREKKVIHDESAFYNLSKRYAHEFEKIRVSQGNEISHVISLNAAALKLACGELSDNELVDLEKSIDCRDTFYGFYIHDLKLAYYIIHGKKKKALAELRKIEKISPPLLKNAEKILRTRQMIQEEIITNLDTVLYNPYQYHVVIANKCKHLGDATCYFWGRGALLSDVQFLSFN